MIRRFHYDGMYIEVCYSKQRTWLNKNNVDYFRRANLPAVVDDDEEQNGGGENNGEQEINGDATGE